MPQITFNKLSISFSDKPILNSVNATIHQGDKIALIGRNGEGKSTLMRAITGIIEPNDGEIIIKNNCSISYLQQSIPVDSNQTLFEVVATGFGAQGKILAAYKNATIKGNIEYLSKLQEQIEKLNIWNKFNQVNIMLEKFKLDGDAQLKTLSGGWRRKLMLAKALINNSDILLLDEPTNHMDIDAILFLEKMLINLKTTLVLISHDRSFVNNIVHKIFDLDRGNLRVFICGYKQYIKRKDEVLRTEDLANARFDKKLSEEESWIRQGIKARRTRNEGRVRALELMRYEYKQRRVNRNKIKIHTLDEQKRVSKLVFEVKNINYQIADKKLIQKFSTIIMKGDKIGIIGGNGVGKTTLIKLLLGELAPDSGNIRRSKTLKLAYFNQIQNNLNLNTLVKDFVGDGSERIEIAGKSKHIIGYLRNFLFTAKQSLAPIKMLSGGEKNRLILAKILAKPANLLVLDEPTNDLDVETLELLEEMLRDYQGTLIVISHDREFLNNVVGSTIVMNNDDIIRYVGGYDDYLLEKQQKKVNTVIKINKTTNNKQQTTNNIVKKIDTCEQKIDTLQKITLEDGFYQGDNFHQTVEKISILKKELNNLFAEWSALE